LEFFTWLEATPLAEWVRVSAFGYPLMITLHSVGLAIMVGLAWVIAMRILGRFRMIPFSSLKPMFLIAWIGFVINFISGTALFTSQAASNYVHNFQFLTKMAFVVLGAITVGYMQTALARAGDQVGSDVAITQGVKTVAWLSILFWLAAIVTGRLIAYLS
jgi:Co/Zn/Cd efflux system component